MKIAKIYLLLLPPLPFQDGGLLQLQPPNFFHGKNFGEKIYRCMGIWTKSGKIDRMAILGKR